MRSCIKLSPQPRLAEGELGTSAHPHVGIDISFPCNGNRNGKVLALLNSCQQIPLRYESFPTLPTVTAAIYPTVRMAVVLHLR